MDKHDFISKATDDICKLYADACAAQDMESVLACVRERFEFVVL